MYQVQKSKRIYSHHYRHNDGFPYAITLYNLVRVWIAQHAQNGWMLSKPFRVALVDDQIAFIDHTKNLLSAHSGFEIIATALDGQEALDSIPDLQPDVAVIDIAMPNLNGFATALRLIRSLPDVQIVMVSEVEDQNYVILAEDVGAVAFLPKQKFSADELIKILQENKEVAEDTHPIDEA